MKTFFLDLYRRLMSRKFWVAIITAAYFATHGMSDQAAAVVLGYLGVQGYVDSQNTN